MRIERAYQRLGGGLYARRAEIEKAVMTRVRAVGDSPEIGDPDYTAGLVAAVSAAIGYGLGALERSEDRAPPVPTELLSQARLAARHGVSLDVVLRRYFAGYALLGDFLVSEAEGQAALGKSQIKDLLRTQAAIFDRIVGEISREYRLEDIRPASNEGRRLERVRRLLAGEQLDTSELAYPMEDSHLGIVADGIEADEAIGAVASSLDCRLLLAHPRAGSVWAWLGSRRRIDPRELEPVVKEGVHATLAVGEPARGLQGWRLTHQQAKAALQVAVRGPRRFVRYAEAVLLVSALEDELLATSLRQLYLAPLDSDRDGGAAARETLRAYLAADRNITAAAASLGVTRRTVSNRLRSIEEKLGRDLASSAADLEVAVRLDQIEPDATNERRPPPG